MSLLNRVGALAAIALSVTAGDCLAGKGPTSVRIYVNVNAPGGGDGTSWTTAFNQLQPALDLAASTFLDAEILVATGVYKPTFLRSPENPRSATFFIPLLKNPVTIYGGLTPGSEEIPPPAFRSKSTLSGDLLGNDIYPFINYGDNAYNIMTAAGGGFSSPLTIEGFRFLNGNASSEAYASGGAIWADAPVFIRSCDFFANLSVGSGGAIYSSGATLYVENCYLNGNVSQTTAGAIAYQDGTSRPGDGPIPTAIIVNSLINNNNAANGGGGVAISAFATVTITNCTIDSNSAGVPGAGVRWENGAITGGNVVIQNSIFWNNVGPAVPAEELQIWPNFGVRPAVSNTIIQGASAFAGPTVSGANPRFRSLSGGDSAIAVDSPAQDAGDNNAFIDAASGGTTPLPSVTRNGGDRIVDSDHNGVATVDLGFYEIQFNEYVYFRGNLTDGKVSNIWQDPSVWYGNAVPRSFDFTQFYQVPAPNNFVRLAAPTTAGLLSIFDTDLTLDFAGRSLTAQLESEISFGSNVTFENSWFSPASIFTTPALYLAYSSVTDTTLNVLSGVKVNVTNYASVGYSHAPGIVNVDQSAEFRAKRLEIGTQNTAFGQITLSDGQLPARLIIDTTAIIGKGGQGVVDLSGGGEMYATAADGILLGKDPTASGSILMGSFAYAQLTATNMTFGLEGAATVVVTDNASLATSSPNMLEIASDAGSTASITVGGVSFRGGRGKIASSWTHTGPGISLGGGGTASLTFEDGGSFTGLGAADLVFTLYIAPRSTLSGNAQIDVSQVTNNGVVRPGTGPDTRANDGGPIVYGTLSFTGSYTQQRVQGEPILESGLLRIRMGSPTGYDNITVGNTANLGGTLFASLIGGYDPPEGESFNVVTAASITSEFNLSILPGFIDTRYFALSYTPTGAFLTVQSTPTIPGFTPPTIYSAPGEPVGGVLKDLNGDGLPDLAVTIPNLNPEQNGFVAVYINQGNDLGGGWLGFAAPVQYTVGRNPRSIDAADFDSDGDNDLIIVNTDDDTVQLLLNNGAGVMTPQPAFPALVIRPVAVTANKFVNNTPSGLFDFAVGGQDSTDPNQQGRIVVFQNTGLPDASYRVGFLPIATNVPPRRVGDINSGDLDNDKDIDVAAPNGSTTTRGVAPPATTFIMANTGAGNAYNTQDVPTGQNPVSVAIGSLRNNGRADFITANSVSGTVSVLLNDSNGPTGPIYLPAIEIPVGPEARSVALADVDNDGDLDILVVITDPLEGPVVRYLQSSFAQTGQLTFAVTASLFQTVGPNRILTGDLTGKGRADLVSLNTDTTGVPGQQAVAVSITTIRSGTLPGDVNNDGVVNVLDLMIVLDQFGLSGDALAGDANFDGFVGFPDLNIVLGFFGQSASDGRHVAPNVRTVTLPDGRLLRTHDSSPARTR